MYILSADFGTTSLKLAILNEKLDILSTHKEDYYYEIKDGGKIQINPDIIFKAFIDGVKFFDEYANKIDIISICVLCPSLIAMNKKGTYLYPAIIHLDRRSIKQSREALKIIGKRSFLEINGNLPFPGGISLTSIMWLRENLPDIYKKTYKFGHLNTYLHKIFTDKFIIDPTNASFTGLYETVKWGGWSDELCKALNISQEKLPEIIPSHRIAGGLSKNVARLTGLREGIWVVTGANDTSSASLGAGTVDNGSILNISGSNEIITITTDKPIPNEKVYLRTHAIKGRWLILAITIGGGALEWFRKEFYKEMRLEHFYSEYLPDFVKHKFKRSIVKFSPYLAGDRHSIKQKKARFSFITLDSTREDFLSSILIGIFEPINLVFNIYKDKIDLKKEIILTGGMVDSAYLDFKKAMFKNFNFKSISECSHIGNGKLALMNL